MGNITNRMRLWLPASDKAWLRSGIVTATLITSAFIGLRVESRLSRLPGLAVLGLLGLLVLIRYLPWGVIALIPISFLVDVRIGTGTNVALNATFLFVLVLMGVWVMRMVVIERKIYLVASPTNLPALLFVVAGILAWFSSFLPWLPLASGRPTIMAQAGAFLLYALSIGAFLLAANILTTRRLLEIFTWTYIVLGIIYMMVQVIPWDFEFVKRRFVDVHYGNSVYWTLLVSLMMGQALFNRDLPRLLRGGLFATAVLGISFGMVSRPEWISGWLPPLLAVYILIWLKNWRVGLLVTVVGGIVLLPTFLGFYNNQVNTLTQQWSTFTRYATWPIVLNLIKLNPLTGLGPAVYPFFTSLYFYLGYYIAFNTHNNYFDIVLQMGFLGLGIFIWLVVVIFRIGWRLAVRYKQRGQSGYRFSQAYANSMLAGLSAALVSGFLVDWFLPFLYNIGIPGFQSSIFLWLFLGGLISLYHTNEQQ